MITLDLAHLSREALEGIVRERCAQYGSIVHIVIIHDSQTYNFALASVEMATADQRQVLLRHLGDYVVDDAVVIRLEQA